jgi:hypothetical protein
MMPKQVHHNKSLFVQSCLLIICFTFFVSCQSREGYKKKMNENTLQPHTDSEPHFQATERPYYYIFQTAHAHTFAALTHGGIELLHCGEEFKAEVLPSGGVEYGGDISIAPPYSDEWIGYGQTRGFDQYNLRTHEHKWHMVAPRMEETVKACRALDPEKNIFAFMIEWRDDDKLKRIFKVCDLSGEDVIVLNKVESDFLLDDFTYNSLVVKDSALFYLNEKDTRLLSVDKNWNPVAHPFTSAYNEHHKKFFMTQRIEIHPTLPIAIISAKGTFLVSWKDNKKNLIPLVTLDQDIRTGEYSFSPDGKYIVWEAVNIKKADYQYFYAEVNIKIPGYIGMPKLLQHNNPMRSSLLILWGTNPSTVLVGEPDGLYWWHVK